MAREEFRDKFKKVRDLADAKSRFLLPFVALCYIIIVITEKEADI